MAFHLLQHDREGAQRARARAAAGGTHIRHCSECHTFTEDEVCATCRSPQRDRSKLCVVETPADQAALERTQAYNGLYFVLMGKLSPLDGIGPKDIGLAKLFARATDGEVQEVILATNFTAEGEATAHVIAEALEAEGPEGHPARARRARGQRTRIRRPGDHRARAGGQEDEMSVNYAAIHRGAYWCVLVAVLLPYACAYLAKCHGFGKRAARAATTTPIRAAGWRASRAGSARANAAQANSFEALPFFIGAVIIAHQLGAPQTRMDILAVLFVTLRIIYIAMYVAGLPTARSAHSGRWPSSPTSASSSAPGAAKRAIATSFASLRENPHGMVPMRHCSTAA